MKTLTATMLTLMLVASTLAQERNREQRNPEREGDIPREMVVPSENRAEQEGTEEGSPSLRSEPSDRRVAPSVLPPERIEWKLGVYAQYTDTGAVVTRVVPGSPAQGVGLERGDCLVSISGFQSGGSRIDFTRWMPNCSDTRAMTVKCCCSCRTYATINSSI